MIFSIDGNIGSGKSTIVRELKRVLDNDTNIIFLEEPVDEWSEIKSKDGTTILEKFYTNQDKYAFSFQMMAYISRLALMRKTIRENPGYHIVTERSIYTDRNVFAKMLYDDGKIEEVNYQIYLKWFDEFVDETKIDHIIYIDTTATKCYERIKKRSRTGESDIPLEYLQKCEMYHDIWILNDMEGGSKNIRIDNNTDNNSQTQNTSVEQIRDFIYNSILRTSPSPIK